MRLRPIWLSGAGQLLTRQIRAENDMLNPLPDGAVLDVLPAHNRVTVLRLGGIASKRSKVCPSPALQHRAGGQMAKALGVGIIGASAERGWAKLAHVPAIQQLAGLELAAVASGSQAKADAA